MGNIGFNEARARLLEGLAAATRGEPVILHDARDDPTKNLLMTGAVTYADVAALVRRSTGLNYAEDDLHQDPRIRVHVLKNVSSQGLSWYLKWYVVEPNVFFLSVHH